MWAIIGGSGFESAAEVEVITALNRETPFGLCSSGLKKVRIAGVEALYLPRHGSYHELAPFEINYQANIYALKLFGADKILSLSAVGSLQREIEPGHVVVPTQYFDRTKTARGHTFSGHGLVSHVSLANPVCEALLDAMQGISHDLDMTVHVEDKTYVCMDGPAFSTRAESLFYRQISADIIGMTSFPEYALAREAGLCYLNICFVSDYDCWDEKIPHVTASEAFKVVRANATKGLQITAKLLGQMQDNITKHCATKGLKSGLITPWEHVPTTTQKWLQLILE